MSTNSGSGFIKYKKIMSRRCTNYFSNLLSDKHQPSFDSFYRVTSLVIIFSHFQRKQIHLHKTITVRYLEPKQAQMYQRAMHFLLTSARRRWLLAEKPAALNHDAMSSESGLFGLYVTVIDL